MSSSLKVVVCLYLTLVLCVTITTQAPGPAYNVNPLSGSQYGQMLFLDMLGEDPMKRLPTLLTMFGNNGNRQRVATQGASLQGTGAAGSAASAMTYMAFSRFFPAFDF